MIFKSLSLLGRTGTVDLLSVDSVEYTAGTGYSVSHIQIRNIMGSIMVPNDLDLCVKIKVTRSDPYFSGIEEGAPVGINLRFGATSNRFPCVTYTESIPTSQIDANGKVLLKADALSEFFQNRVNSYITFLEGNGYI